MEGTLTSQTSIIIELDGKEYAIPVERVRAIERMQSITRVPNVCSFVTGVINLRGIITPIIDLRKRFGMEETEPANSTRIVILQMPTFDIGLIVDAAYDVIDIPKHKIEQAPSVIGTVSADYIDGVANLDNKRLIMLLQLDKVISKDAYLEGQ